MPTKRFTESIKPIEGKMLPKPTKEIRYHYQGKECKSIAYKERDCYYRVVGGYNVGKEIHVLNIIK